MKKYIIIGITLIAFLTNYILADSNIDGYKKIEDLKKLSSFKSIMDFEIYYKKYIQECLDNRGGDIAGIHCMIESDIWDRELNISYQKLYKQLDQEGKVDLKHGQSVWVQLRDLNLKLVFKNLSQEEGTMYRLINAGEVDEFLATFTKFRTVFLQRYIK